MAKVYEAMLLSQANAPDATRQFLQDYNFSEVLPNPMDFDAEADPLDLEELGLYPPASPVAAPVLAAGPIGANVAVAEAIAESVTSFATSLHEAPFSSPAMTSTLPAPPVASPFTSPPVASASYQAEFVQLSEILLRTATERTLKTVVVCGLNAEDRAGFVWENLSQALADNSEMRVARFNLLSPAPTAVPPPSNGNFQIKIHRTATANLCEVVPLNGALPLGQLLRECDIVKMLELLKARFDFILLETDAVNWTDEVAAFAGSADGVILVAQKETMRGPAMQTARQKLQKAGAHVLGAVLSRPREQEQFQRVA